jgi:hypothetical protein
VLLRSAGAHRQFQLADTSAGAPPAQCPATLPADSVITQPVYLVRRRSAIPSGELSRRARTQHGVGLEILLLGADGRIVSDYQFIEG